MKKQEMLSRLHGLISTIAGIGMIVLFIAKTSITTIQTSVYIGSGFLILSGLLHLTLESEKVNKWESILVPENSLLFFLFLMGQLTISYFLTMIGIHKGWVDNYSITSLGISIPVYTFIVIGSISIFMHMIIRDTTKTLSKRYKLVTSSFHLLFGFACMGYVLYNIPQIV